MSGTGEKITHPTIEMFAGAHAMVPYYTNGRVLMPGYQNPGLAVPLDGDYVVKTELNRSPYVWLRERMARKIRQFATFADDMKQFADFSDVQDRDVDSRTPYLPNGYFSYGDALALTTILATRKPARYIEIGSGNSTKFARRAISKYGLNTKIECIDPNPRSSVRQIADKWVSDGRLDVDPLYFQSLEDGDVLMLDGSHLLFHGSDTTHFFLRIYPLLKSGVIVHVHDIHLPYEYPEVCDRLFWNEQYILAMMFYYKPVSDIIAPIKYMHREGMCEEGASFWFEV